MDMDNSVEIDCRSGVWMGRGGQRGKNWDNSNRVTIKNNGLLGKE